MQFPEHLKEENNLEKEKKSTKLEVIVFNVLYVARGQNEDKKNKSSNQSVGNGNVSTKIWMYENVGIIVH